MSFLVDKLYKGTREKRKKSCKKGEFLCKTVRPLQTYAIVQLTPSCRQWLTCWIRLSDSKVQPRWDRNCECYHDSSLSACTTVAMIEWSARYRAFLALTVARRPNITVIRSWFIVRNRVAAAAAQWSGHISPTVTWVVISGAVTHKYRARICHRWSAGDYRWRRSWGGGGKRGIWEGERRVTCRCN